MNEKLLLSFTEVHPRAGLLEQVITIIQHKQQVSRLWRIRLSVGAAIASVAALIPTVSALITAFADSHFGAYASLLFSDGSVALAYWKVISLSLVEALPAAVLALTLGLVGVLVWSTRAAIRSMAFTHSVLS